MAASASRPGAHRPVIDHRHPGPMPKSESGSEIEIQIRTRDGDPKSDANIEGRTAHRVQNWFPLRLIDPKTACWSRRRARDRKATIGPRSKCVCWRPAADRPSGPRPLAEGRSARGHIDRSHRAPAARWTRSGRTFTGEKWGRWPSHRSADGLQPAHSPAALEATGVDEGGHRSSARGRTNTGPSHDPGPTAFQR